MPLKIETYYSMSPVLQLSINLSYLLTFLFPNPYMNLTGRLFWVSWTFLEYSCDEGSILFAKYIKIKKKLNLQISTDPDEATHKEPSHLDMYYLLYRIYPKYSDTLNVRTPPFF